jgi:hypothetical protein
LSDSKLIPPSDSKLIPLIKNHTHFEFSEILKGLIYTSTLKGKDLDKADFLVNVLLALNFSYLNILMLFQSSFIPSEILTDYLNQTFEINDCDLRFAWIKCSARQKDPEILNMESEWYFVFCNMLGFTPNEIVKIMHKFR